MSILILGLIVFLAAHSVRIVAEDWRTRQVARLGELRWKALYSLVSATGLVLIVWGYGLARAESPVLWNPPLWTYHLSALLTVPSFILLTAAYVPGNRIRFAALGHPMVVGVKLWAFAHLVSNGRLADVLLFGSFLAWALLDFRSARRRGAGAAAAPRATVGRDVATVVIGLAAWAVFALTLHGPLIGVRPFG